MTTEAFEQFIAPARRYPAIWRIILGLSSGLLIYVVLTFGIIFAGNALLGIANFRYIFEVIAHPDTPEKMALLMSTFLAMWAGAWVAALWHWRGLGSLVGPVKDAVRHWLKALWVAGSVLIIGGFVVSLLLPAGVSQAQSVPVWLSALIWALPLLFIQTAGEELIFRGYLQQQFAARFRSPLIWMGLPSVLFGLAHYNSELDGATAVLIVGATGLFGLVAADITRLTGNLGAAMGFHFINNFMALLLVGVGDNMSALALFMTEFTMQDSDIVQPLLVADMLVICVVWYVLRRVFVADCNSSQRRLSQ